MSMSMQRDNFIFKQYQQTTNTEQIARRYFYFCYYLLFCIQIQKIPKIDTQSEPNYAKTKTKFNLATRPK